MTASATDSTLHVANGTSTLHLIEAAGLGGRRSLWADPLHEGPVPGHLSDAALVAVRTTHLTGGASDGAVDPRNDLDQWRAAITACGASDEVILWYEHDLFDQLNLVQVLTWMHTHAPAPAVSLVCIGSFPGRAHFKGLGELTPAEVASLFASRRRVGAAHYETAARAWHALGAETPDGLERLRATPSPALPFLSRAVGRFLQEFPWTRDGLSRSERRLLQLAAPGSIRLRDAFPAMHEGEDAYFITDTALVALSRELAATSPPLITLSGAPSIARGTVALTDAGRAVLDGARDRVTHFGVDRWLGGVHLRGTWTRWRWDGERGALIDVGQQR